MPTIEVAREAGACYGVNRALELVRKAAAQAEGPIHTLGPLIHNPTVVASLADSGVTVASEPDEYHGGTLVLRTHGVTPEEEARARDAADSVLDATCPFVVRAHRAAETLTREGYQVLVFGEAGHRRSWARSATRPEPRWWSARRTRTLSSSGARWASWYRPRSHARAWQSS